MFCIKNGILILGLLVTPIYHHLLIPGNVYSVVKLFSLLQELNTPVKTIVKIIFKLNVIFMINKNLMFRLLLVLFIYG